jgi:hypothetical protein
MKQLESCLHVLVATLLAITVACGGTHSSVTSDQTDQVDETGGGTPLSFYEEELVGSWYRYHAYDKSGEYYRFNTDRTACYWEEHPSGSGQRTHKKSYSHWDVASDDRTVNVESAGITLTFDYADMELWPTGYSNLVYSKSGSDLCD